MVDIGVETTVHEHDAGLSDYFALMKPRVMQLVVFTAVVGLLAAPVNVHPIIAIASILFVAIGAGASGALNMWWDADIDAVMKRTAKRPIPSGTVTAEEAKILGFALAGMSIMMLALSANFLAAGLLAFTIFFYIIIYSAWLKRTTPQNIVIGGAAGAFPPVIGWVIATGSLSFEPWLMFALIFVWTPPHFWALALFMKADYHDAGVPMLTVTHGRTSTRKHIFVYTVVLALVAVGTAFTSIGGLLYLAASVPLNILFLKGAYEIWCRSEAKSEADDYKTEKKFFKLSLWYLFLHFGAILAGALMPIAWFGWS